jgi:maleate isomerase
MLALNADLARRGVRRLGLVTPYLDDVQVRILRNYAALGIDATNERHLDDPGNFSFALIGEATIRDAVDAVARAGPEAIAIVCTNLRAAQLVPELEARHGVPVVDSLAAAVRGSLDLAGVDSARVEGWGRLFTGH